MSRYADGTDLPMVATVADVSPEQAEDEVLHVLRKATPGTDTRELLEALGLDGMVTPVTAWLIAAVDRLRVEAADAAEARALLVAAADQHRAGSITGGGLYGLVSGALRQWPEPQPHTITITKPGEGS